MKWWKGPLTLKMQGMSFLVAWITSDAKTELTEKSSSLEANTGRSVGTQVPQGSTRFHKVPDGSRRFWKSLRPSRSLVRSLTL